MPAFFNSPPVGCRFPTRSPAFRDTNPSALFSSVFYHFMWKQRTRRLRHARSQGFLRFQKVEQAQNCLLGAKLLLTQMAFPEVINSSLVCFLTIWNHCLNAAKTFNIFNATKYYATLFGVFWRLVEGFLSPPRHFESGDSPCFVLLLIRCN